MVGERGAPCVHCVRNACKIAWRVHNACIYIRLCVYAPDLRVHKSYLWLPR